MIGSGRSASVQFPKHDREASTEVGMRVRTMIGVQVPSAAVQGKASEQAVPGVIVFAVF